MQAVQPRFRKEEIARGQLIDLRESDKSDFEVGDAVTVGVHLDPFAGIVEASLRAAAIEGGVTDPQAARSGHLQPDFIHVGHVGSVGREIGDDGLQAVPSSSK